MKMQIQKTLSKNFCFIPISFVNVMPLQRNINSWYNKMSLHITFLCQLTKLIDAEEEKCFPLFLSK